MKARLVLLLAVLVLTAAATLRGAEYDEQYTLFLTAGTPRPVWPEGIFPAATVAQAQAGHATLSGIARDLRATDVHPPLYFWAVALWRRCFGPSLMAARLLSVLCGALAVGLVGGIARARGIWPLLPMLLTLGCYGFAYTGAVARGFALPELLSLGGTLLVLRRRAFLGGILFGAACAANYLAVFVAVAVIAAAGALAALPAMLPFVALDAWCFAAQHASRPDQFPMFALVPGLLRLAKYQAAAVFGGLPAYAGGLAGAIVAGMVAIVGVAAVRASRPWRAGGLLLAAACAPAAGLLLLGAAFDNTPIELRYLSFGLPFLALLLGRNGISLPLIAVLLVQSAGIAGLLTAPSTMQPARAAARGAAELAGDGIVLLPRGNDGVGIVGAFGIEAPPSLRLLLVRPTDMPAAILARLAGHRRVVLALLGQDRDSLAAMPIMRAAFAAPNWRRVAIRSNVEAYERTEAGK